MSIGLTLRVAYKETCEICDTIAKFTKSVFKSIFDVTESIGYAVAASRLANMGYHEEAKALMIERARLKK
jgi:hypothetical protein